MCSVARYDPAQDRSDYLVLREEDGAHKQHGVARWHKSLSQLITFQRKGVLRRGSTSYPGTISTSVTSCPPSPMYHPQPPLFHPLTLEVTKRRIESLGRVRVTAESAQDVISVVGTEKTTINFRFATDFGIT